MAPIFCPVAVTWVLPNVFTRIVKTNPRKPRSPSSITACSSPLTLSCSCCQISQCLGRLDHVTTGAGRDFPLFPTIYIHSSVSDRQTDKSIRTPISINLYICTLHTRIRDTCLRLNDGEITGTSFLCRRAPRLLPIFQWKFGHNIYSLAAQRSRLGHSNEHAHIIRLVHEVAENHQAQTHEKRVRKSDIAHDAAHQAHLASGPQPRAGSPSDRRGTGGDRRDLLIHYYATHMTGPKNRGSVKYSEVWLEYRILNKAKLGTIAWRLYHSPRTA